MLMLNVGQRGAEQKKCDMACVCCDDVNASFLVLGARQLGAGRGYCRWGWWVHEGTELGNELGYCGRE